MEDKKLKSLEEFNKELLEHYELMYKDKNNGIACPDCNEELLDTQVSLLTNPPKRQIYCKNCNYRGYRIA